MITINVAQQVLATPEQISQVLLAHEQLDRFFNAEIRQLQAENSGEIIGGKGAIRQISIGKIVFEEEIIGASAEHICYRIIGDWPVSSHQGDIQLTSLNSPSVSTDGSDNLSQIDYVIHFNGPQWLPDFLLKFIVRRDIKCAMKKLAQYFADKRDSSDETKGKQALKSDTSLGKSA